MTLTLTLQTFIWRVHSVLSFSAVFSLALILSYFCPSVPFILRCLKNSIFLLVLSFFLVASTCHLFLSHFVHSFFVPLLLFCLYICLLSVCSCLFLCLSLSLSVSISLCVSVILSVPVWVSHSLSVSLCVSVSVSNTHTLVSVSLSLAFPFPFDIPFSC